MLDSINQFTLALKIIINSLCPNYFNYIIAQMFFTRTHQYKFSIPKEHLRFCLVGNKVKIHNLDFEVQEQDNYLRLIPQDEDVDAGKTLPVTQLELKEDGNKTNVVITSKMRPIDSGGTLVMLILCLFLFLGSFILFLVSKDPIVTISLCAFSLLIFTVFMIRMQASYFDYIREIRTYIKFSGDQITSDVRRQLFKHKLK